MPDNKRPIFSFTNTPTIPLGSISSTIEHNQSQPNVCKRFKIQAAVDKPRVTIHYCTGCRWGLRASWVAQELLVTFEKELLEVALRPSENSGVFDIFLDDDCVWSRKEKGRFPELKEVKQAVRDTIAPNKSLGHSDR